MSLVDATSTQQTPNLSRPPTVPEVPAHRESFRNNTLSNLMHVVDRRQRHLTPCRGPGLCGRPSCLLFCSPSLTSSNTSSHINLTAGVLTAAEMKHSHPVLILKLRHVTQCERCSMRFYSFGLTFVCFSGRQKIQLEKETSEETLTCAEKPAARREPQTD